MKRTNYHVSTSPKKGACYVVAATAVNTSVDLTGKANIHEKGNIEVAFENQGPDPVFVLFSSDDTVADPSAAAAANQICDVIQAGDVKIYDVNTKTTRYLSVICAAAKTATLRYRPVAAGARQS